MKITSVHTMYMSNEVDVHLSGLGGRKYMSVWCLEALRPVC